MVNSANIESGQTKSSAPENFAFSMVALTCLFFLWGFITSLHDILIPHLKNVFSLNYTQAMLIQFCFFGAYFVMSIPAGKLARKMGYKYGIVVGLIVAGIGCLFFYPAAGLRSYSVFLFALFTLASGITMLQVAANPYVALMGNPETASSRLTLTQAFNSAGTTIAPFFGSVLILSVAAAAGSEFNPSGGSGMVALQQSEATAVQVPYLILAAAFLFMAAIFATLKLPQIGEEEPVSFEASTRLSSERTSAWSQRHLVLGAIGIFVYVGAEVSIGSFLVNFLGESTIVGLAEPEAAKYIAYYWGGAMVGRFIGAVVMRYVKPGKLLALNSAAAMCLIATAILSSGSLAMWAILAVGLCNSIMFPTIFSLAINKLGPHTSQGSGILCLAIVGGALIPLLQGVLADMVGIQLAFVLPLICYLYIAFYGLYGSHPAELRQHQNPA